MAIWAGLGSVGTVVGGTTVAAVVVVGGVMGVRMMTAEPSTSDVPVVEASVETTLTPETPTPSVETAPAIAPNLPSFDLVRVDADGSALVAGRAVARSTVAVLIDGSEVHQATADSSGSFAAIFFIEPVDKPRVVSLRMAVDGQDPIKSSATVILAPVTPTPDLAPPQEPVSVAEAVDTAPATEIASELSPPSIDVDPDPETLDVAALTAPDLDLPAVEGIPAAKPDAVEVVAEAVSTTDTPEITTIPVEVVDPVRVETAPDVTPTIPVADIVPTIDIPETEPPLVKTIATTETTTTETMGTEIEQGDTAVLSTSEIVVDPTTIVPPVPAQDVNVAITETTTTVEPDVFVAAKPDPIETVIEPADVVDAELSEGDSTSTIAADVDPIEPDPTPTVLATVAPVETVVESTVLSETLAAETDSTPTLATEVDPVDTDVEPTVIAQNKTVEAVETVAEGTVESELDPTDKDVEPIVVAESAPVQPVNAPVASETVEPDAPVIEVSNISIGDSPSINAPNASSDNAPTILALADATPSATPSVPAAPSVLLADDTGIRVLQSGGDAPLATQTVIIDTISYDPAGDVALGGRGTGAGFVRVYLNNKPIKTTRIGIDGQWSTPLPEVDTGVYTLRVDEIDEAGVVTSRMETPFKREEPEIVAALDTRQTEAREDTGVVTVQPGNTLWGIASEKYGDGLLYVRVFEANRERIRNADLIYPGQIFEIPE